MSTQRLDCPRRRFVTVALLAVIAVLLGLHCARTKTLNRSPIPASGWHALASAERFDLLALGALTDTQGSFHSYLILGTVSIPESGARRALVQALQAATKASDGSLRSCIAPRHGIRVTSTEGKVTDFVFSFECWHGYMIEANGQSTEFTIAEAPAKDFDEALVRGGASVAPPTPLLSPTSSP